MNESISHDLRPAMKRAAKIAVSNPLQQMPSLITDRSLANSAAVLAEQAFDYFKSGYAPAMETISMPKNGFGPRPICILSPATRTLYEALIDDLKNVHPEPSRSQDFTKFLEAGTESASLKESYLVDFDIAACYEYVDHSLLGRELLIQGGKASTVASLLELLGALFSRGVGIPQALTSSHVLGDIYLEQVSRSIQRLGFGVNRYVDDFRITAPDQTSAYKAIQRAVEIARTYGLVLADGKTRMQTVGATRAELLEVETSRQEHWDAAAEGLGQPENVSEEYDEITFEDEIDEEEIDTVAWTNIIDEWSVETNEERRFYARFGSMALIRLKNVTDRIDTHQLVGIVTKDPIRLDNVLSYIGARPEMPENWIVIEKLANLPRQSPWSALKLLCLIDQLVSNGSKISHEVLEWVKGKLGSRYETVRAEAAWVLASSNMIGQMELNSLYINATDVTRPGLAACAGILFKSDGLKSWNAFAEESQLTKEAFRWGKGD